MVLDDDNAREFMVKATQCNDTVIEQVAKYFVKVV